MFRITRTDDSDGVTTLELQGRIVAPWVEALNSECRELLERGRDVQLDMSGVSFIGSEGVEMLEHLPPGRLRLVRCSPLLCSLLDGTLPCDSGAGEE